MVFPFTEIKPILMSSSASRREQTPLFAIYLLSLILSVWTGASISSATRLVLPSAFLKLSVDFRSEKLVELFLFGGSDGLSNFLKLLSLLNDVEEGPLAVKSFLYGLFWNLLYQTFYMAFSWIRQPQIFD